MKRETRSLIVDLDSQGNVSDAFGLDYSKYTALNMFRDKVQTSQMITRYNSYLDVIQADEEMGSLELDLLLSMTRYDEPFAFVKPHINSIRGNYDFIFVDTPPSLGLIVGNAITAADYILIPFVPEPFAIKGLKRVIKAVTDFQAIGNKAKILAVVPMFVVGNTVLHSQLLQQARQFCDQQGVYMADTAIPRSIEFAKATAYEGVPATISRRSNEPAVIAYLKLWEELRNELCKTFNEQIR